MLPFRQTASGPFLAYDFHYAPKDNNSTQLSREQNALKFYLGNPDWQIIYENYFFLAERPATHPHGVDELLSGA
jgi:hypothetical protein